MKEKYCMEIISFNIAEEFGEKDIEDGLRVLDDFYKGYEGYNEMNVISGDNKVTLIIKWENRDREKFASGKMMQSSETVDFKKIVIPQTVDKKLYETYTL